MAASRFDEMRLRPLVCPTPSEAEIERIADIEYKDVDGVSLRLDIYRPSRASGSLPVAVFVHGDLADPELLKDVKEWGQFRSWGALTASNGIAAVTFDHRSARRGRRMSDVVEDIEAVLDYVASSAEEHGLDGGRIALVAFSMGVPYGLTVAFGRAEALRCAVAYYGPLDLTVQAEWWGVDPDSLKAFSPLWRLAAGRPTPPLLVVRAGRDHPQMNLSIDRFVAQALERGIDIDLVNHAEGQHGFDIKDPSARSRDIISATLRFLHTHLHRAES